jgi:hypothetical protein
MHYKANFLFSKWDNILRIGHKSSVKHAKTEETGDLICGMGIELYRTKE